MFLWKNNLVSSLRAEAPGSEPDDPKSHDLTIVFNEANWGHRWKDTIPRYHDVNTFQKHLLSLSCVSLKGFKRFSYEHVNNLIPQVNTKFWIRGLIESIMDTEATMLTTSHPFETQQRVLQILGCSKQDVMADDKVLNRWVKRSTGQYLCQQLMMIDTNHSDKKLPHLRPDISVLTPSFNLIMREESQRYENVHHPESSNEPLKIYNYEQLPEFIVNWIILSVFPIASEINETHWGVPVMFKLMEFRREGSSQRLNELKQALVIVLADLFQVLKVLEDTELLKELLGDDIQFYISENTLDDLMLKVGMFIEGLVPLMAYTVLCSTTSDQKLLNQDAVVSLLMSGRHTKRILFKNFKQATGTPFQCLVKSDNDDQIARDLLNQSIMKTRSVPDSVIHYASDLMNTEDVAALDQTIQDLTTEEDPGKDDLLGNGDDESVTIVEPLFRDLTIGDAMNLGVSGDSRNMLSFAGSTEWLKQKERANEDTAKVTDSHKNLERFESPVREHAEYLHNIPQDPLSSTRLRPSNEELPAPRASLGRGFRNISGIAKPLAFKGYEVSEKNKHISVVGRANTTSEDEKEFIDNFETKINSLIGEMKALPKDIACKLKEYLMQTPFGVHKETWITVGTFVANNMDSFHNLKSLELRIAGAFFSARTLCRIISENQDDVNKISPGCIVRLAKDELSKLKLVDSKQTYMKYNSGGLHFLMSMILTVNRQEWLHNIIHCFVKTDNVEDFVKKLKKKVEEAKEENKNQKSKASVAPQQN